MPGPGSKPWAKDPNTGRIIQGKSAVKRSGLGSRANVNSEDKPPEFKEDKPKGTPRKGKRDERD